eukprot:GFYU01001571.1.p1 GENE.GFYU01001571.1~~GFYU01001571.1.p1  ORF type:complete len:418 (-),score=96.58 GFYU01001571.1:42-1295(-)
MGGWRHTYCIHITLERAARDNSQDNTSLDISGRDHQISSLVFLALLSASRLVQPNITAQPTIIRAAQRVFATTFSHTRYTLARHFQHSRQVLSKQSLYTPVHNVTTGFNSHFGSISRLHTMVKPSNFKFASCQLKVGMNKEENIEGAKKAIAEAAKAGANVILLPECFNCPYGTKYFPEYAEELETSTTAKTLSECAKEHQVYLIGGSFPELDDGKVYNTCMVYGPDGKQLAKHRKMHLFNINVPGKIKFMESETLTAGDDVTTFESKFGVIGVAICYDIRFQELAQLMASKGAVLLCYPGAFNMTTGPAHWELLQRARAVDNQLYVATASPCRNPDFTEYTPWGHSSVVNPWGEVIATTEGDRDIVYADIDIARMDEVRSSVPVLSQKRYDLYKSASLLDESNGTRKSKRLRSGGK